MRFKIFKHAFSNWQPLRFWDGLSFEWKEPIALEIPKIPRWDTVSEPRRINLSDEVFEYFRRFFEAHRFPCVPLVSLEIDVVEGHLYQATGSLCQTWQSLRSLTIGEKSLHLVFRSSKTFHLFEDISNPTKHGDGTVVLFKEVFKINNNMVHGVTQLMLQTLLHRPSGQSPNSTSGLGYLTFKKRHDFTGEQVTGCGGNVIHG